MYKVKVLEVNYSVSFVDPNNKRLQYDDSPNKQKLGIAYLIDKEILIANNMQPIVTERVLIHEITHAYLLEQSLGDCFGCDYDEEAVCDFLGLYGEKIVNAAKTILAVHKENIKKGGK